MPPDVRGRDRGEAGRSCSANPIYKEEHHACQAEHRSRESAAGAPRTARPPSSGGSRSWSSPSASWAAARSTKETLAQRRPDRRQRRRGRAHPRRRRASAERGDRPDPEQDASADDPGFDAVIDEPRRSSRRPSTSQTSPRRCDGDGGGISDDGHSALRRVRDRRRGKSRRRKPRSQHYDGEPDLKHDEPRVHGRPVRRRQRQQGDRRHPAGRRRQGGDALAADHPADPARRARRHGRRQRSVRARPHLGAGDDGAWSRSPVSCSRSAATSTR